MKARASNNNYVTNDDYDDDDYYERADYAGVAYDLSASYYDLLGPT